MFFFLFMKFPTKVLVQEEEAVYLLPRDRRVEALWRGMRSRCFYLRGSQTFRFLEERGVFVSVTRLSGSFGYLI